MYVYAFLKVPNPSTKLPMGIESVASLVICDQLAALVEPNLVVDDLQQSDERLIRAVVDHDRVIQELFDMATVLPLRFGTVFLSEQHLFDHLQAQQDHYLTQLDRLDGKAEYLVKFHPHPFVEEDGAATAQRGRDYFLAKKQRYQAQTLYKQQQKQELGHYLDALRQHGLEVVQGEGDEEVERVYVLGDRHPSASMIEWLQDQGDQQTCWHVSVGTPLPPYHFVS